MKKTLVVVYTAKTHLGFDWQITEHVGQNCSSGCRVAQQGKNLSITLYTRSVTLYKVHDLVQGLPFAITYPDGDHSP